jgi:Ca2+-binding RTX toxin-like protein
VAALAATSAGLVTAPSQGAAAHSCGGRVATIVGNASANEIHGTSGPDVIVGLGGNDDIEGRAGNDVICGNRGNDEVEGGPGRDFCFAVQKEEC